jgi:hypothetical protein
MYENQKRKRNVVEWWTRFSNSIRNIIIEFCPVPDLIYPFQTQSILTLTTTLTITFILTPSLPRSSSPSSSHPHYHLRSHPHYHLRPHPHYHLRPHPHPNSYNLTSISHFGLRLIFFRYFYFSTFLFFDIFIFRPNSSLPLKLICRLLTFLSFDIFVFRHFSLSTFLPFDILIFRHFYLSTF